MLTTVCWKWIVYFNTPIVPLYKVTVLSNRKGNGERERSLRVYSKATRQNKLKHMTDNKWKKNGTNGNEETWQEKGERAGIDGIMFILQEVIRLKEVCTRDEQMDGGSNGPMCTSKEIQRQRKQKDGLSCTGERWWCCSTSFWGKGCNDLAVEKKGEQKVLEGGIKKEECNINHMQKQKKKKKMQNWTRNRRKLMKKGGCVGRNKGKLILLLNVVSSYQF